MPSPDKKDISPEESATFRKEMESIQNRLARRRSATGKKSEEESPQPKAMVSKAVNVDENKKLFRRNGIQNAVFDRWRRQQHTIENELDLHGKYRDDATKSLDEFIQYSINHGYQNVRVIHGRGQRSVDGQPILRQLVRCYMQAHPDVKGYQTDSADGAMVVWLKRRRQPR